jgi:DegV family protein with EDD domain
MAKQRVKVLVDSTAGIGPNLSRRWGLVVVPLYLTFGQSSYRDGVDLQPGDFYRRLAASTTNPSSAAPSPGDFARACAEALEAEHQSVLIVTVSAKLSGTYGSAMIAAKQFDPHRVAVLDTGQGAGALALVAERAAAAANDGGDLDEVLAAARAASRSTAVFMALDTLQYLLRSGRISAPKAAMAEWLRVRPVVTVQGGSLQIIRKARTMRRATQTMLDLLDLCCGKAEQLLVMYGDQDAGAVKLEERLRKKYPQSEINTSPVSGVIGCNAGPGILGVAVHSATGIER